AHSNKLSLEHIIPFGIAGNSLMLPKASCQSCAKITSQVEQACLRHLWWPLRTRMGAPTGQPKERPTTFKLRRVLKNGPEVLGPDGPVPLVGVSDIAAEEYP